MKAIKKITALIAVIVLALSASGCAVIDAILGLFKYPLNAPAYSERKFEMPDKEAVYAKIDQLKTLSSSVGNDDAIKNKRSELFADYYNANTSRVVAEIEYYKNINDEQAKKNFEDIDVFYITLNNDVLELEKVLFSSSYKDLLVSLTSEQYCQSILDYDVKSEELIELEAKETALVSEYMSVSASGTPEQFARIYKDLVVTRNRIAALNKKADGTPYSNYHEYAYDKIYGRDYTPDEIVEFRTAIKDNFYTLAKRILSLTSSIDTTDVNVSEKQLKEAAMAVITATAPDMLPSWNYMTRLGLYDFSVSDNKMNTSFVIEFPQYGDGFMFINASGALTNDLNTVLHEFGHYNAIFATDADKEGDPDIYNYDLLETHSQCFELITLPAIKSVANEQGYQLYTASLLLNSVWTMLSNCMFDEFEYVVYNATSDELTQSFIEQTFETVQSKYWPVKTYEYYEITHLFSSPSYCISYAVSRLFSSVINDSENNVEKYLEVVSYGEGHYLGEICEKTGLPDPLDKATVEKTALSYDNLIKQTFNG